MQSDPQTRTTIPARASMSEAEHWLLSETIGGWSSQANEIRAARISGGRIRAGAEAWLRGVAGNTDTLKSAWAQMVLDELVAAGQVRS